MYCEKCGNEISGDSKFCEKCGAKVTVRTPESNQAAGSVVSTAAKSTLPIAVKIAIPACLGVVAISLVVLVFVIKGNNANNNANNQPPVVAEQPTIEPTKEPVAELTEEPEVDEPTKEPAEEQEKSVDDMSPEELSENYNDICNQLYQTAPAKIGLKKKKEIAEHCAVLYQTVPFDGDDTLYDEEDNANGEESYDMLYHISQGGGDNPMFPLTYQHYIGYYENDKYSMITATLQHESDDSLGTPSIWFLIDKNNNNVVYARNGDTEHEVSYLEASSTYKAKKKSEKNIPYSVCNLIDNDITKAWVAGDGKKTATIDISLDGEKMVHGVAILNGYMKAPYYYYLNRRVKKMEIIAAPDNKKTYKVSETSSMKRKSRKDKEETWLDMWSDNINNYTYLDLPHPEETSEIKLKIKGYYPGKDPDIAITGLYVY